MKTLTLKKTVLGVTFAIAAVLLYQGVAFLEMAPQAPIVEEETVGGEVTQGYVPGEILVKFKEGVAGILEQELKEGRAIGELSLTPSLKGLFTEYGVAEIKPVFSNFKEQQEKINLLKTKDISLLTPKERHLLNRLKRGPKDEKKKPNLSCIFEITLGEGQSVLNAVEAFNNNPYTVYAQLNYIYQLHLTPLPNVPYIPNDYYIENDQNPGYWREGSLGQGNLYPDLWGHGKIEAIEGYNVFDTNQNGIIDENETTPGEGVIVGVIDTGIDRNHEDIQLNLWLNEDEIPDNGIDDDGNGYIDDVIGYDFSNNDNDPSDYHGHGTHVSGTIAATGDNTVGVIGVAYGAKIMTAKGFPNAYSSVLAAGIRYAAYNGADVLSNSWGYRERHPSDPTIEAAIDDAYAEGCVIVFAAGNNNDDIAYYSPENHPNTIAVAATNYQDQKASFSSWGELLDVAAPGVDVLSLRGAGTDMYGDGEHIVDEIYYRSNGTSMACPHVAGVAASIISIDPLLSNDDIRQIIRDSADDLGVPGFDIYYGYGRVNLFQANLETSAMSWISFDRSHYTAPSQPLITLKDVDINIDPDALDTVAVEVLSSTEQVPENLLLTETGLNTSVFRGAIALESGNNPVFGDGIIKVQHGDVLTARYIDENPPPPQIRTAIALIDLEPPVISQLQLQRELPINGVPQAIITWQTDEPSNSTVYYGTIFPPDTPQSVSSYVTDHLVILTGVEFDVPYFYYVESEDMAGNISRDDNNGIYYEFIIIPPDIEVTPMSLSFETLEGATELVTDTLTIENLYSPGALDLLFEISLPSQHWLSSSPDEDAIPNGSATEVNIAIDPEMVSAGTYTSEIIINNNTPLENPTIVPVGLTTLPAPAVHFMTYMIIDDWTGRTYTVNGNRRLNAGEQVELQIKVKNVGTLPGQNVTAYLSLPENNPYITILDDTTDLGSIQSSEIVISQNTFLIAASNITPDNYDVIFRIEIIDSENHSWHDEFLVRVTPTTGVMIPDNDVKLNDGGAAVQPTISSDNSGSVYVAWYDGRGEGYDIDIYFNHSENFGTDWQANDIKIHQDTAEPPILRPVRMTSDDSGDVYVVWDDYRNGAPDVYFNYSYTKGTAWQPNSIRLDTDEPGAGGSSWTDINSDNNGNIYVVWQDGRNGPRDVYFNCSHDYGATWQPDDIRLDTTEPGPGTGNSYYPKISSDEDGNVYVVWSRGGRIYFNYSHDYGATWQADAIRLDTDGVDDLPSYLTNISSDDNGNVYTVWGSDSTTGTIYDVYFNYSHDYGATWQTSETKIDIDETGDANAGWPQISCDNTGNVYVAWSDAVMTGNPYWDHPGDVYINYSHDYGATWQAEEKQLNTVTFAWKLLMCADAFGRVYTIWNEAIEGNIYLSYSLDFGLTWLQDYGESEIRLNRGEIGYISSYDISCNDVGDFYAAWTDYRRGKQDIYFIPVSVYEVPDYLQFIYGQVIEEGSLLQFDITAANPAGGPLEIFFDVRELPEEQQDNLSSATLTTRFNSTRDETTGTFRWTPPLGSEGVYEPVVFVARDPSTGSCAYQAITITVEPFLPDWWDIEEGDIFVDDDAIGVPLQDGSIEHPFDSIGEAIDVANAGNTVFVFPGTYNEQVYMKDEVDLVGSGASLTEIIVDIPDLGPGAVLFSNLVGSVYQPVNATLSGFTISNISGDGVIVRKSSPDISNNIITGCARWAIKHYQLLWGNPQIVNNTIANNGSGIYSHTGEITIRNSIISGNNITTGENTGIKINSYPQTANISYNDMFNNQGGSYVTGEDDQPFEPLPGTGEMPLYPLFVNETTGDYHLRRRSPAIDKGDPNDSYYNEPLPNGHRINMGAYGNTNEATISKSAGGQIPAVKMPRL